MQLSPSSRPLIIGHPPMLADLVTPVGAAALIVIAHPDEASRDEAGQQFIADVLRAQGFATLSFSLRTPAEDAAGQAVGRGVIERRRRICSVLEWAAWSSGMSGSRVGLMGLGRAVASCVAAAAQRDAPPIGSLVLIDGRPELAASHLARLKVPTLMIVGGSDPRALSRHRLAARLIQPTHRLKVLDQPTHPSISAGAHEATACEAAAWFVSNLTSPAGPARARRPERSVPAPAAEDAALGTVP